MQTLCEIRDALAALAIEIADAVDDRGMSPDTRTLLLSASTYCANSSTLIAAVADSMHSQAVADLAELCRCGHDKGDHLVVKNSPGGACEHTSEEGTDAGAMLVDPCPCRAFESSVRRLSPRRDTVPTCDSSPTERPGELAPALP